MEDKVKAFLASGKLEEYIYGGLGPNEQAEVEAYIQKYPEVLAEYELLQRQLEQTSIQQAMKPPIGMKSQILESLTDKPQTANRSNIASWSTYLAVVAVIAAFLLGYAWKQSNDSLEQQKNNYAQLAEDCEKRKQMIQSQQQQIAFLSSEQTRRYDMQGNDLAPSFKAMVLVNEPFGKAILTPLQEVPLPAQKCLQLWGDLEGEMIPIAVLNDTKRTDYDLSINPNFTSLNITIEDKTADGKGQDHPDVSQLIASIII